MLMMINDSCISHTTHNTNHHTHIHRLHDACLSKLLQSHGWKAHLETLAKQEIGLSKNRISLEDLTTKLVLAGKSSILLLPEVKQELRQLVQESMIVCCCCCTSDDGDDDDDANKKS